LKAGAGMVTLDTGGLTIGVVSDPTPQTSITFSGLGAIDAAIMPDGNAYRQYRWYINSIHDASKKAATISLTTDEVYAQGLDGLITLSAGHVSLTAARLITAGPSLYVSKGIMSGWTQGDAANRGQFISDLGGVHDYEALVLLDTGDIAHGMTSVIANTAAYGALIKYSATSGGVDLRGFGEGYVGACISGRATLVTTGTNTAPVVIDGAIKSGTGIAALTGGNLLTINNYGASRVIVKHNGDIYSDSTAGVLLFDDHDDAALLRALSYELNPAAVIRNRFDDFVTYHRGDLEAAGIVEGTMVNQTALTRLLTGAIWQLHSRIAELEERLARRGG